MSVWKTLLNKAIFMAQKTSDQIKANTYRESELIIDEAKKCKPYH